ncbi:MAG: hypothetical protein CME91_04070 [Hyphomonadaceae bacterium]|nr:hypothetical protein [Hyphomonadaceae bacterium]MBA28953.1 hypothetical protein [Hyphomonadaceae bacterium]
MGSLASHQQTPQGALSMKIWVDGQCLQTSSRNRGIGRYVFEFLRALSQSASDIDLHVSLNAVMADEAIAARRELLAFLTNDHIHVWHGMTSIGEAEAGYSDARAQSQMALTHHVNCLAPDVALCASTFEGFFDPAVPLFPNAGLVPPLAAIFYDAIPYRYKDRYLRRKLELDTYERRLSQHEKFDKLLSISDFSLNEARDLIKGSKGTNISAGVSLHFLDLLSADEYERREGCRKSVVYIGALDWRKNVEIIPKAFALLNKQLRDETDFILAGDHPQPLIDEISSAWADLGLPASSLKQRGLVSDRELIRLYKSADAILQPSYMEGFGLTALEALICGTPVIASNTGALPEVVQIDEMLFDPNSPKELSERIEHILQGADLKPKIAHLRDKLFQTFSWEKVAATAVQAFREIARQPAERPDTQALRERIAVEIKRSKLHTTGLVEALALAEPFVEETKRLLVDATSTIQTQYRTGIQRVVRQICSNFSEQNVYGKTSLVPTFSDDFEGWYRADSSLANKPDKTTSDPIIFRPSDTVFMLDSSWDSAKLHKRHLIEARLRGAEVISCLYDMVPLKTPAFCDAGMPPVFRDWLVSALEVSTGFVCISKAVADELYNLLKSIQYPHRMKIGYWRLGADFSHLDEVDVSAPRGTRPRPSFLMVGTLEPRKGHNIALDAFEVGWASGMDADLTIVGKFGWGAEAIADRIKSHPEYGNRLHWRSKVDDAELVTLYNASDALIAASYAEGFGLPIVEAGRFGIPIIASDIPVFKEVTNGAQHSRFFDTGSSASLLKTLRLFCQRDWKKAARQARVSQPIWPNWAESAEELLGVIVDQGWYKSYEPESDHRFRPASDLGCLRHTQPIAPSGQAHVLSILPGSMSELEDGSKKFTVAVTNESDETWFGQGLDDGRFGVALGYRLYDAGGNVLFSENLRSRIVMAIAPGDTHLLPVTALQTWIKGGASSIEIELVQDGVAWWGSPLRVELDAADPVACIA